MDYLDTWYSMILDWPKNIGVKPSYSFYLNLPSFIPILFEITIFCLTYFFKCNLYPGSFPKNPDVRTTDDKFLMEIRLYNNIRNKYKIFMYKKYIYIFIYIIMMVSCNKNILPKNVYMPDMYYSKAYEPDRKNILTFKKKIKTKMKFYPFGKIGLNPVKGTIPQNKAKILPYTLPNNNKGYNLSKEIKISPLKGKKKSILKRGKYLYDINCAICHGSKGDGKGILVKNEKIFGVPSYKELDICIGSIFNVIMYGKNNMGSYYSNLSMLDRWKIAEYVMNLKYKN